MAWAFEAEAAALAVALPPNEAATDVELVADGPLPSTEVDAIEAIVDR